MNLFECIGGGSSELQETVLWTNSSPTSSFANQVVTLSDDINNYDYIKFYFRVSTSNSASQNVMAPVSDFKNLTDASTSNSFVSLSSPNEYTGSYRMARRLNYESATSVRINDSFRSNSSGTDNTTIIPTAISGLKYASPKPSGTETTLWENSDDSATFAAQSVSLSDSIANYSKVKFTFRASPNSEIRKSITLDTSEFVTYNGGTSGFPNVCSPSVTDTNGYGYTRRFYCGSVVSVGFTATQRINSSGNYNTFCVPSTIIGIS